jgi:hypothetical protein
MVMIGTVARQFVPQDVPRRKRIRRVVVSRPTFPPRSAPKGQK